MIAYGPYQPYEPRVLCGPTRSNALQETERVFLHIGPGGTARWRAGSWEGHVRRAVCTAILSFDVCVFGTYSDSFALLLIPSNSFALLLISSPFLEFRLVSLNISEFALHCCYML